MSQFKNDFGSFTLDRLPKTVKGGLRAWDAADELILNTLYKDYAALLNQPEPLLIINDAFGALAVSLHEKATHSWSDSYLSQQASTDNFQLNQLKDNHHFIRSTEELPQSYQLVIIKIPKTLTLLEDQLIRLKPHITADTTLIAGAMSKHIHNSTLALFEKIIGTTTTSRATKKARLIFSENTLTTGLKNPFPKKLEIPEHSLTLYNHANVFSHNQLDIGARFLIQQLEKSPPSKHIIDLGCGNGVLGIVAQSLQKKANLSFIDESYLAIASAKDSYQNHFKNSTEKQTNFIVSDCFNQYNGDKADLILCNPPFHQAHAIGDHIAWQMFQQSNQQLNLKGELWVVANRHLAYHIKLKKLFGNCRTIAANKKFVVLAAHKR
jgi:16S rRNA G1207 methylase RsmC